MKTTALISLLGLSGSALGAAVETGKGNAPFGYKSGSKESIANMKDKIENVVWVLLENRGFDNILGGVKKKGLDNVVNNGPFYNLEDISNPDSKKWPSQFKNYDSVLNDPDHTLTGTNFELYGTYNPDNEAIANGSLKADLSGFVNRHMLRHPKISAQRAADEVLGYYSEGQIPTIVEMVDEFTTFNNWHSCVPGPTNPNRLCAVSGVTDGHGKNDESFDVSSIESTSIFEAASEKGISWLNYDGTNGAFNPDALFFDWTTKNAKSNVVPLENFYQDAYLGLLPQLSYINPSCCGLNTNSMHPAGNVSFGEVFLKQIYDAVRTGPQWEKTLLLVTFDETGGFYDHVAPPLAVRPDNKTYTEKAYDGSEYTFSFDRLGGRIPTWLLSPYTPKGHVEGYGTDPVTGESSSYSATSVLKTLGYLWDLKDLSPRVEHSPAFDHLIGPMVRSSPETLKNPHTFPNAI
ncbi:Non-specific phospholipase C1 [Penicillium chrysogenum]|uniref:Pc15g01880 protein n=2 Tax=Penicillium chrysogenum species complex TaxID=254878 RepID=B6H6C3_PENRW|nr:Non-specific phospholipase C1 [Penicillium chrysogenum]CAP83074.1 Pc15g01880 [Penicillium rubens Wisconsin 54-1255]